jgi:hypothetical protein
MNVVKNLPQKDASEHENSRMKTLKLMPDQIGRSHADLMSCQLTDEIDRHCGRDRCPAWLSCSTTSLTSCSDYLLNFMHSWFTEINRRRQIQR